MNDKVLKCFWKISINGILLDDTRNQCIESVSIDEQCDGSDTCTIQISDPEFLFISDNIFVEESTIEVKMGWEGGTQTVTFKGYISAIDIDFPPEGFPSMSLFCLDNSHKMNRKDKKRSWDKTTSASVIKKIAKEYGFKCYVQSGYTFKKEDTISQSGATDIAFCESLADKERDPFMCKLIGDTLYYVKKGILNSPVATVYYKMPPYDVVSFSPKINKETQKEEHEDSNIVTKTKKKSKTTSTKKTTVRQVQGKPVKTAKKKVVAPANYTQNRLNKEEDVRSGRVTEI